MDHEEFFDLLEDRLVRTLAGASFFPAIPASLRTTGMRKRFPFGSLERVRGGNIEFVEIELDRLRRRRFRLNFGERAGPDGAAVLAYYTVDDTPSETFGFGGSLADLLFLGSRRAIANAVERAHGCIPLVLAWFQTRAEHPSFRKQARHPAAAGLPAASLSPWPAASGPSPGR